MHPDTKTLQPERGDTDRSLRVERKKSDSALIEKRAIVEDKADDLIEQARDQADAALDTARVKADAVIETATPSVVGTAVAREREQADRILQTERASADQRLKKDRQEQAAAMAARLPQERERTDRFLLTERLRSDDALAQRDAFLGMVSHDLRNLLHGIVLNATLLSAKAPASEEGHRTIDGMQQIQQYATRMNRLIGDLLDVVSLDAGRLEIQPQSGDAATLLAEISLVVEVIRPPLEADFDHQRMLQVLSNLLSNALKFTPEGGAITVRGRCSESQLEVTVSDTGSGIPADELEAVFERFRQVGKNDRSGFGLGLYISKSVVEVHGGSIWAESTPGEGSTFHLTIPRRAAAS
jgi:signal transduction histidine kinase